MKMFHKEKNINSDSKNIHMSDLRVPDSNWERFKNIVNTPREKEKSKSTIPNLKSKRRKRIKKSESVNVSNMDVHGDHKQDFNINNDTTVTKCIAMDCEMVGVGDGIESMIARVSIVNKYGACIYDKYVKPRETVKDYRTAVSGIRPCDLETGDDFQIVQREVAKILRGRILVGHALKNDLEVLYLSHPKRNIRDTSRYKRFRQVSKGNTPSLKKLAAELLGIDIQSGEHNSIEDARTAMQLYMLYKNKWESDIHKR